jgi:hypothetical protein
MRDLNLLRVMSFREKKQSDDQIFLQTNYCITEWNSDPVKILTTLSYQKLLIESL